MQVERKQQKKVSGVVVSRSGDKSITIRLDYKIKHPLYGKYINRRTKLNVHDTNNEAVVGDVVEVVQCRQISKTKSWRLLNVVQKAVKLD